MPTTVRSTVLLTGFLSLAVLWFVPTALAQIPEGSDVYRVTQLDGNQDFDDFVVGPGKFDLVIAPGESAQAPITITNRSGERKVFTITTEDMAGSNDPLEASVLLGDDRGPYTLRDFLQVTAAEFYLEPGQRATVPVTVSLPFDAEPGGRYGSLLVQTASTGDTTENVPSTAIVSRIAILYFVTTPGELERSGELINFNTLPDQSYFSKGPISFGLLYENTGTVHTNPSGFVRIYNLFGTEVGTVPVQAWFALPESTRLREVTWERELLFGRYTAVAEISRGYGSIIDTRTTNFWVVDWMILVAVGGGVFSILFILRVLTSRFTIARRNDAQ